MSDGGRSLGEFLRHERELRGITLEQVASATKVSVRQLHSLEADQYADMPAKPFIRGFVTSYARFINLDPLEVLIQFDDFIDAKVRDRPSRDSGHSGYAFETKEGDQSRSLLWALIGSLAFVSAIGFIVFKPKLGRHHSSEVERLRAVHTPAPSPTPSVSPTPVTSSPITLAPPPVPIASSKPAPVKSPVPVRSPAPVKSPIPIASPSAKPDPLNSGVNLSPSEIRYKVLFKAVADVWVRYRSDDRPVMQFILRKGRILVLRAEREISLQASSAQSVILNPGGQGYRPLAAVKNLAQEHGNPTYHVSSQPNETKGEFFPGAASLPAEVPPSRRAAQE